MGREFNTPTRAPWNKVIKTALDAVDEHNNHYFKSQDLKHLIAAQMLREYVVFLKDWITLAEQPLHSDTSHSIHETLL